MISRAEHQSIRIDDVKLQLIIGDKSFDVEFEPHPLVIIKWMGTLKTEFLVNTNNDKTLVNLLTEAFNNMTKFDGKVVMPQKFECLRVSLSECLISEIYGDPLKARVHAIVTIGGEYAELG